MTDALWLRRHIAEKQALDAKLLLLLESYDRVEFNKLPYVEKMLMMKQGISMSEYSQILSERIYTYKKRMEKEDGPNSNELNADKSLHADQTVGHR